MCQNQVLVYGFLWDVYGFLRDVYGMFTGHTVTRFSKNTGFLWEEYGILRFFYGFLRVFYGFFTEILDFWQLMLVQIAKKLKTTQTIDHFIGPKRINILKVLEIPL